MTKKIMEDTIMKKEGIKKQTKFKNGNAKKECYGQE